MPELAVSKWKWGATITIMFLISFFWHRNIAQFSKLENILEICQSHDEEKVLAPSKNQPSELQRNISKIFKRIEQSLPNITITNNWKNSTSGQHSKGFIVNAKDKYCVGDVLTVQYDMYDHLGNRKKYGGDFLRPRIFTPELQAGASGKIEDFNNGTYHLHFILSWEGRVKVSTLLFHPSEGIAALWRSRHASLGVLDFQGRYKNETNEAITQCGFKLESESEVCEYIDHRDEEAFYCVKPPNLPCGSLKDMRAIDLYSSYLSPEEKNMFVRSNIGVHIPLNFDHVDVVKCDVVKYFDYHESGFSSWEKTLLAINMDKEILVSYKRHGFPLESFMFYLFREDKYISRQIDEQGGGAQTIFAITIGQHFRQYPIQLYIRRALNIRKAIERLLIRSPDTKVIIKTENTRDMTTRVERLGDFNGYCQYLVLREVFKDLNVGFVDAFDMTIALATENVHPQLHVLENIMSLTFTYAC